MSKIAPKKLMLITFLSLMLIFSNFGQVEASSTTTVDLNKMFTFTYNAEQTVKSKSDNSGIQSVK